MEHTKNWEWLKRALRGLIQALDSKENQAPVLGTTDFLVYRRLDGAVKLLKIKSSYLVEVEPGRMYLLVSQPPDDIADQTSEGLEQTTQGTDSQAQEAETVQGFRVAG